MGGTSPATSLVRFTAPPDAVRAWIRGSVVPVVTTAAQQLEQTRDRSEGRSPGGGTVTGFFLSAAGYGHLGLDTDRFASGTFRRGMKHQDDPLLGGLIEQQGPQAEQVGGRVPGGHPRTGHGGGRR